MIYVFIATKTTADAAIPTRSANQAEFNRRIANGFRAQAGGHVVAGDLKLRPIGTAIVNHLLCDGSAVSRVQFNELYALLGDSFGAGDGSTTFNLPDYRDQALETAAIGPVQHITEQGTVDNAVPVEEPTGSGEIGGTIGGNTVSGGRVVRIP